MHVTGSDETRSDEITRTRGAVSWLGVSLAFVATFALAALAVAGMVVLTDPHAEFGTHVFLPLTVESEAGRKLDLMTHLAGPPDAIILGSSRSMKIDPGDLARHDEGSGFNLAFSRSTTSDALHAYEYVAGKHPPRTLVYGLEPDQFRADFVDQWAPRPPLKGAELLRTTASSYERTHVIDALSVGAYSLLGYPTESVTYDGDGTLHYHPWEDDATRSPPQANPVAFRRHIDAAVSEYSGDDDLVDARFADLRTLVDEARANGTTVRIFFTPNHPERLAALGATNYTRSFERVWASAVALCGPGVHVFDFSHVDAFGGDPDDFVDSIHYGPANARRIVDALYGGGDACS